MLKTIYETALEIFVVVMMIMLAMDDNVHMIVMQVFDLIMQVFGLIMKGFDIIVIIIKIFLN